MTSNSKRPTQQAVAEFFSVVPRTVRNWRAVGAPINDVRETARWLAKQYARGETLADAEADASQDSLAVQKLKAEITKLRADAAGKQLKNDAITGRMIPVVEAEQVLSELCAMIRARLEALPDALMQLFPNEIRDQVTNDVAEYLRRTLTEMSECELQ